MRKIDQYIQEYNEKQEGTTKGSIDSIRSLSYLMGFLAIFVASASFNFQSGFLGGPAEESLPIWHIRPLPFPIIEVIFLVLGAWLLLSTYFGRSMIASHAISALSWLAVGIDWIAYGIIYRPDYVFVSGVVAVFIAAQHVIIAHVWSLERVV
mgnify:CR=1 FL=1